ncbi:MAG TPA: hypothetical protein VEL76_14325 [Gemmataceae bacterium]|nr:hypothetical protein [Gemmataceae bacterium]
MGTLVIPDAVPNCDLERVELEYQTLSLALAGNGRIEETIDIRVMLAPVVDEKPLLEFASDGLGELLDQTEGEEQEFYTWVLMMLAFHLLCPELDQMRRRRFNVKTLRTSETLRELAQTTRTKGHTYPERLLRFAGVSAVPTTRLLQEAIYVRPDLALPLSEKHYLEFRDQFFSEIQRISAKVERIGQEAVRDLRRKLESDDTWPPEKRVEALQRLQVMEQEPSSPERLAGWQKAMRFLVEKALEIETETAGRFADLVEQARTLQEPVSREVEHSGLRMLAEDGESFTDEYADCICRNFKIEAADSLLDQLIARYMEVFQIPQCQLVTVPDDFPVGAEDCLAQQELTPNDPDSNPAFDEEGDLPVEWQQYASFLAARDSEDVFEKWYTVGWILTNLVNRNECIRLLQREAESVDQGVLDYAFKLVYRKIRHRLTYLERRVFKLMYFRQPIFGYRIAAMDPVILSFVTGMDDETQLLTFLVLVLKRRQLETGDDLAGELERRWRAFLRFYPYWLMIVQDEDCQRKRGQTIQTKTLYLDAPGPANKNGDWQTLKDRLPDPKGRPADVLQAFVSESGGRLAEWAARYCSEAQARYITRYAAGVTEIQIARECGVSQPAVSKGIRVACQRIRDGLRQDGLLET